MSDRSAIVPEFASRVASKWRRTLAGALARRVADLDLERPVVSFTFDDAPRTAFEAGSTVLEKHGARGSFYVSLGLLSTTTEIGPIGDVAHLARAFADGHELGCHTFDHLDAWHTPRTQYLGAVDNNARVLAELLPEHSFETFAYPKNGATWDVKTALSERFLACRGGGQVPNLRTVDLDLLRACFLDRRARVDAESIGRLIERTAQARGWMIFVAHDVSDKEHPYSCPPSLLDFAVRQASAVGAELLPVAEVARLLMSRVRHANGDHLLRRPQP